MSLASATADTWPHVAYSGFVLGVTIGIVCGATIGLIALAAPNVRATARQLAWGLLVTLMFSMVISALAGCYMLYDSRYTHTFGQRLFGRHDSYIPNALKLAVTLYLGSVLGALAGTITASIYMLGSTLNEALSRNGGHTSPMGLTLRDLLLPFNLTKYIVVAVGLIGTIWGMCIPSDGLLLTTYTICFGSVMWCVAALYLCDCTMALSGRSTPFWHKFYGTVRDDLAVCAMMAITLTVLYYLSPDSYSWYNLDLGLLGAPFVLYSVLCVKDYGRIKVAGRVLPIRIRIALSVIFISLFVLTFGILFRIQSKTIQQYEALWYQITIFCSGVASFIGARQIRFMLEEQKIEPSPVFRDLFASIKSSPGLYAEASRMAAVWNRHLKDEKTKLRIEQRRAQKRRRGKK